MFLNEEISHFTGSRRNPESPEYDFICSLFEKALSSLGKMPRLWLMYLEFTLQTRSITLFRRVLNRSLQSLPITQHERMWDLAMNKFVNQTDFPVPISTCKKLFSRYILIEPAAQDQFIDFLLEREEFTDAVEQLILSIRSQEEPSSLSYFKLINVLSKNSNKLSSSLIESVDLPGLIRAGLNRFPDEIGNLWNHLADFYIRMGMFGRAIEVYEEALSTLSTVSDFSLVFNSYQNFLDLVVKLKMESSQNTYEMDLERLELLIERRPELVSSVLLRQNPHNIAEWVKRTKLTTFTPDQVVSTFTEGLMTVDVNSKNLVGRISTLWCEFGRYYFTTLKDIPNGRLVFEKAIKYNFKTVDDLSNVWIEWILLELKSAVVDMDSPEDVRWTMVVETARRAISQYRGSPKSTVQSELYKSVKLWNLVIDIEESLSTPQLVRAIYTSMTDLGVITPALILSWAQFEQSQSMFENTIRVLEKGIGMFPWPHCRDIWVFYLNLVLVPEKNLLSKKKRTRVLSTERIRDLFDQVITACPGKFLAPFLFLCFKFELDRGMARTCISILSKGASNSAIPIHERVQLFYMALSESVRLLGASASRKIFDEAIETFTSLKSEKLVIEFCLQYAAVESQIGEIERGRRLFHHAAQFANPKNSDLAYMWDKWRDFELEHGNEETYKDMKRVRRSVDVLFSDKHFNTLDAGSGDVTSEISTGGIDLSKLMQSANEYGSSAEFIPSNQFMGSKDGYVFTTRANGTGYYQNN